MQTVTFQPIAKYISVVGFNGEEIGGIYPGAAGGTFNLVVFKQCRGNFDTLYAAQLEAIKIAEQAAKQG